MFFDLIDLDITKKESLLNKIRTSGLMRSIMELNSNGLILKIKKPANGHGNI